jgi:hypothetical protein
MMGLIIFQSILLLISITFAHLAGAYYIKASEDKIYIRHGYFRSALSVVAAAAVLMVH